MKIIFVTIFDARDIKNWSGIPYYLAKGFSEAGIEVEFIDNLESLSGKYFKFHFRDLFYNRLLKKRLGKYISFYEPKNLKFIANQVSQKINKIEGGIIFSPGTIPIAYLNTNKPIFYWTDATFAVMENYYEDFKGLSKKTIKDCHLYERNAIERSSLAIYSSEWAAKSAINDYGDDPSQVKIIPFGANIDCKRTVDDIIENNLIKSRSVCKLLFIGKEWDRKGGDTAVRIATDLNKRISVELTIVGCIPPSSTILPDFVKVIGFIDKTKPEGMDFIESIYKESHFFLLPSRAEAMGVVFCEANSFGLPVITTNTGGISSIIKNDINGKMFDPDTKIEIYTDYIEKIFRNFQTYNQYSLKCFNEYLTRVNWKVSINKCISYIKHLEKGKK